MQGSAMTAACDEDAATCQPPSGKTLKSVGVVGRCLSKKVAEDQKLTPGCKSIVSESPL